MTMENEQLIFNEEARIKSALTKAKEFEMILDDMLKTFIAKNADYGGAFDESLNEDGLIAAKVRMMDKMRRFSNLIKNDAQVKDESMIDTLKDMANYSVMTILWLESQKKGGV